MHRKYTGEDFDEDLRTVLRRSGCKNEKIAFIMDESNVLDSGFLERMNTLLANGEVTSFVTASQPKAGFLVLHILNILNKQTKNKTKKVQSASIQVARNVAIILHGKWFTPIICSQTTMSSLIILFIHLEHVLAAFLPCETQDSLQ